MTRTARQRLGRTFGLVVVLAAILAVWLSWEPGHGGSADAGQTTNTIGIPVGEIVVALVALLFWATVAVYLVRRARRRRTPSQT